MRSATAGEPATAGILIDDNSSYITLQRLTIDGQELGTIGVNIKTGSNPCIDTNAFAPCRPPQFNPARIGQEIARRIFRIEPGFERPGP